MKLLLLALAGLLSITCSRAQDLIVTDKGDSINCKITKIKPDYIYFTFKHENEVRNTLLAVGSIRSHRMNFYDEAVVPASMVAAQKKGGGWLAIRPGWGYRIAPIPEGFTGEAAEYLKKLKSGFSIYTDAGFSVSESLGFGLIYSGFFSKNSNSSVSFNGVFSSVSDKIAIHYVGPAVRSRFGNADTHYFTNNISLGMITYRDDATFDNQSLVVTGKSVGFAMDLGVEFPLQKANAFLLNVGIFAGALNKVDISSGSATVTQQLDPEERESLTRVNLSIGLRFYK